MTLTRRNIIVSLALAPALPAAWPGTRARAVEVGPTAPEPRLSLVAADGGSAPHPPLRYGDGSPGPVLRLRRGVAARIVLRNAMASPTSLDLHGLRLPQPLGAAGPLGGAVAPGGSAEILVVPEDAGTFWYHPWLLDPHTDQTALGLSGGLIVEEPQPPDIDADLVAMLTDRLPDPAPPPTSPPGSLWVDGRVFPRVETLRPGSRVRLRLVNGSTRQAIAVTLTGASPFVLAIDGQPSELFKPRGDTVPLGPGARTDLMVDLPETAGAEVGLLVRGADPTPAAAVSLNTGGEPRAARGPIVPLPPNPLLPRTLALEDATRATLAVDLASATKPGASALWAVNGGTNVDLPRKPLLTTRRGRPVTLAFKNTSPVLVAFRLHGFSMRVLHDLDDGWDPYWRDTIMVPPGQTHHAAFLADRVGHWLIESPFFDQAVGGLRTWFEVT